MSKIKLGIKNGVRVKQGDVIGYVGSTDWPPDRMCVTAFGSTENKSILTSKKLLMQNRWSPIVWMRTKADMASPKQELDAP